MILVADARLNPVKMLFVNKIPHALLILHLRTILAKLVNIIYYTIN